jgi:O-antigen/teichoic acid export membrane protein
MGSKSQIKAGASLSYVLMLVTSLASFLLYPFLLRMLGAEGYGLYATIGAMAGYLAVMDFGVNSTITRYIAKYRAEGAEEKQNNLLAHCVLLYSVLAIIVFIIGYILYLNLPDLINIQSKLKPGTKAVLSPEELKTAGAMFIILIVNIALSLPLRSFTAVLNGHERFAFPRAMNIVQVLLRVAAIVIFLNLGFGAIAIVVIDTALNLSILIVNMLYSFFVLKVKVKISKFEMSFIKELLVFSLPIFLTMVYDQIFWKVDQTIIIVMKGASAAGLVSSAMFVILIFMRFSTALSDVFLPRVTKMVVNDASGDELTDLMIKVGRIQFLVLGMMLTGYLLFGQDFFNVWVAKEDPYYIEHLKELYFIGAVIMIPLSLPLIQNTGISILVAKNKHKFRSIIYFIIAVLNIGLTIFLVNTFGIVGASIATAIALTIGNGFIINIYYSKVIGLKIGRFFKDCVFRLIVPMVIASAIGYVIARFFSTASGWGNLLLCCFAYAAIYFGVMWLFGMNTYEKGLVRKVVAKILRQSSKL